MYFKYSADIPEASIPFESVMSATEGATAQGPTLTSRDLLDRCDGFPLADREPERYAKKMSELYTIVWEDNRGSFPIGYMLKSVFEEIKRVPILRGEYVFNKYDGTIKIFHKPKTERKRTELAAAATHHLRVHRTFKILENWRNELWPVYGRNGEILFSMERSSIGLFGFMRYGIHLIAYTPCRTAPQGIKLWVPKRSKLKAGWPGMLDNTVAGGLMTGEDPFECMVREAEEEASLPEYVIRQRAKPAGVIRYIFMTEHRPDIEDSTCSYVYPECQWVFEVELPEDVIPAPNDGEVESFSLCTVDQVREQLAAGRWKPNCAVIILDFLVRMGILTPANEPDFDEIETRLRRKMPFPGPHDRFQVDD